MCNNNKNKQTFSDAEKIRHELNALLGDTLDPVINTEKKGNRANNHDAAKGMAASMNIFSGVVVGGFLGYGFDYLFGTLPLATALMLPVGMIAGFRNMLRSLDNNKPTANTQDNQE